MADTLVNKTKILSTVPPIEKLATSLFPTNSLVGRVLRGTGLGNVEYDTDLGKTILGVHKPFIMACALAFRNFPLSASCWVWAKRVTAWTDLMVRSNGLSFCVTRMKELALALRRSALGLAWDLRFRWGLPSLVPLSRRGRRVCLFQLSKFARALPEPDDRTCAKALEEHTEVLTSTFCLPSKHMFGLYILGERVGQQSGVTHCSLGAPSPAASFESSRGLGGAQLEVVKLTNSFRARTVSSLGDIMEITSLLPLELFGEHPVLVDPSDDRYPVTFPRRVDETLFLYPKGSEMSLEDWELVRERLFCLAACWLSVDWNRLPRVRRTVVRERGWKTRVVTPEEAAFGHLCSIANKFLLSVLETVPGIRNSLKGEPARGIEWYGKRRMIVRSLDLKSASDYIPLPASKAVALGLLEGCNAPLFLRTIVMRAVGPHTVIDGDTEFQTRRAALMGNPVTWPLLCLMLLYAHEQSGSDGVFAINGDDYIGCHTHASNRKLTATVQELGLRISEPKDFTTRSGWGVFSEELVSVGRCRVYPTLAVRTFFTPSSDNQPAWAKGPEVATRVIASGLNVPYVHALVYIIFLDSFKLLRRVGIDPVGPRWCGGAGFPGVPGTLCSRVARGILSQSADVAAKWLETFSSAWSGITNPLLEEDLRGRFTTWVREFSKLSTLEEGGLTADELLSRLRGHLSPPYLLAFGKACLTKRLRITRVSNLLTKTRQDVLSTAYWVPVERVLRWDLLHSRLASLEPRFGLGGPLLRGNIVYRLGSRADDN